MLQHLYEGGCLEEAVVRARVEPGHAAAQIDEPSPSGPQVLVVEVGNLQLAARGRTKLLRQRHDLVVVKIEAGDGEISLRLLRLLLERQEAASLAHFRDSVALRIVDPVPEQRASIERLGLLLQKGGQALTMEDVVTQHEADAIVTYESFADEKRFGKSV